MDFSNVRLESTNCLFVSLLQNSEERDSTKSWNSISTASREIYCCLFRQVTKSWKRCSGFFLGFTFIILSCNSRESRLIKDLYDARACYIPMPRIPRVFLLDINRHGRSRRQEQGRFVRVGIFGWFCP